MKLYAAVFFGRHISPKLSLEYVPDNKVTDLVSGHAMIELSDGRQHTMPPRHNGISHKMIVLNEQDLAVVVIITKSFEDSAIESNIRDTMTSEYVTIVNNRFGTSIKTTDIKFK